MAKISDDSETTFPTRRTPSGRRGFAVLRPMLPWVLLIGGGSIAVQVATWPDVAQFDHGPVTDSAFMQSHPRGRDAIIHTYVPLDGISPELQRAVVAAEDARFFAHPGFDTHEIMVAVGDALARGRVRGASTLSQQLAKNLFLSRSRSLWRKLKEALLTRQLEGTLTKERILELYLNVAQFGPDVFGAEAAAQFYFNKPAADLDREEAAALAAVLPRPARWYPGVRSEHYAAKIGDILSRMAAQDSQADRR